MTSADANAVLAREHPAAARLLSPLGRRAALPLGIPQQSAQSAHCARQATIGQITRGDGAPLTPPSLTRHFVDLDPRQAFLYAPQLGFRALREAWARHASLPSLPIVTAGVSHALSLACDLFTCEDQPLLVATPYWDNYDVIATMRTGAPIRGFPFYGPDDGFNVAGLGAALARLDGPATLLLNFPNNPCGYAPYAREVPALREVLHAHPHPLAVLCDDAYHGMYFEPDMHGDSVFRALCAGADPERLLVCKIDGATKELVFFGGRVGFLGFGAAGAAADVLLEKAAAVLRGTISSVSAPSQAAVLSALRSPTLAAEQAAVLDILRSRYRALKSSFAEAGIRPFPFNGGCFAMVPVRPGDDCDEVRMRLIREQSVGVIAVPMANALRVAFCSIDADDIPDLVRRLAPLVA